MKIPAENRRTKIGFNMTPMIDVVFLLIIFFLVSSHLAQQETQMNLPLPIAKSGEDEKVEQVPRVTVNITPEGNIYVSGRRTAAEDLQNLLTSIRQNKGENIEVRIRGSRESNYGHAKPVMLACAKAKIWDVSFAVYREEQE
jgi:biopolymer transport protein ExbD